MQMNQAGDLQIAAGQWLQDVPWQLFATLEFPSARVRFETAHSKLHEMLHTVEHSLRTRVGCVYAAETRSKSGAIVPLHFHAALTALRPIEYQLVMGAWGEGRANSVQDLARVKPYDPSRGGIEYIMKQITDHDCQWGLKDVELFSNSMPKPHMGARANRRWLDQLRSQPHAGAGDRYISL